MQQSWIPYRAAPKLDSLYNNKFAKGEDLRKVTPIPKYKPYRQRLYAYAHVHGFHTYMIDIVFFKMDGMVYAFTPEEQRILNRHNAQSQRLIDARQIVPVLIAIHCNSRFGSAIKMDDTSANSIAKALNIVVNVKEIKKTVTFISDADRRFPPAIERLNDMLNRIAEQRARNPREPDAEYVQIKHIQINMSDPDNDHTMLAPLDRFSRTLRDMIFNLFRNNKNMPREFNQQLLDGLCSIHNRTPHKTLSTVMGFPVSPRTMMEHNEIHQEFVRRLAGRNYNIPHDDLSVGTKVYVYQPPSPMKKRRTSAEDDMYIVERTGPRYLLRNERTGKHIYRLRSKLFKY